MPETPSSDQSPSQEPSITPDADVAAATWSERAAAIPQEVRFATNSGVRINSLDRGVKRDKEARRDPGLEL